MEIIQNKLLLYENLQHMGFQLASICDCCDMLCCSENVDHVFAQNPTTKWLYKFMDDKMKARTSSSLISLKLNE